MEEEDGVPGSEVPTQQEIEEAARWAQHGIAWRGVSVFGGGKACG